MSESEVSKAQEMTALAKALRASGDGTAALAAYESAAALWRGAKQPVRFAHAARHAGDVARELGRLDVADRYVAEALLIYREHEVSSLELANTLRVSALIKQAQNKPDQAKTIWKQARHLYEAVGMRAGVDEADERLAELP